MRKLFAILMLLATLAMATQVYARGGQSADDCPPGSTDPDCKGK